MGDAPCFSASWSFSSRELEECLSSVKAMGGDCTTGWSMDSEGGAARAADYIREGEHERGWARLALR